MFDSRNLELLPLQLRRIATAAVNGSFKDTVAILSFIKASPSARQSQLFLPVCWAALSPSRIPSEHELESVLSTAQGRYSIKRSIVIVEIVRNIPGIPTRALVDLWPHVWVWIDFLHTYHEALPDVDPPESELLVLGSLFGFLARIPASVVDEPAVRVFVAKAWKAFVATGDVNTTGTADAPAHIAAYTEGAGGSDGDLAALILEHIWLGKRIWNLDCIRNGVNFALHIGLFPLEGPFHASLRAQGVAHLLGRVLDDLAQTYKDADDVPLTFQMCCSLLEGEFSHPSGYVVITEAIRSGLLRAIVHFAASGASYKDSRCVEQLLLAIMGATAYYSVLRALEEFFPEAEELSATPNLSRAFSSSTLSATWKEFVNLTKDRLKIKQKFDAEDHMSYGACDNLECGTIQERKKFKACAGCRSSHRAVCGNLRSDRSFQRALVHETYHRHKERVLNLQLSNMRSNPGKHFNIAFDFSTDVGTVAIGTVPFGSDGGAAQADLEIQRADYEARARRDPRIELHLVQFSRQPWRVFVMRSSDARVHQGLLPMAQEVQEDDTVQRLEALLQLPIVTTH
ncbi:hypothetical protein B0H13DRAFT_1884343 [Mycena leptocephala]|nr:hypothetical protein B0H13DRAFT_1884343 [Mycena leptocephala]